MQAAPMARLQQKTQAAVTTGPAGATGIPCAMVLRHIARSPRCAGLCSHRRLRNAFARLDPSVGGSGPHAFAVREAVFAGAHTRAEHPHVHRIPLPTSVTIASRPSRGIRMRREKHNFLENGSKIFLRGGLDRGNQVEIAEENCRFGAVDFEGASFAPRRGSIAIRFSLLLA